MYTSCASIYGNVEKNTFSSPEDQELCRKWIYFVNCKDWTPKKYSVMHIDHAEKKFIKHGKS